MRTVRSLALALLLAVAAPGAVAAQSFEGTVHQRILILGADDIAAVIGATATGDARPDADALFGASDDKLTAEAATTTESSMFFKGKQVRMQMPAMQMGGDMPSELADMMKGAYTLFDADSKEMTTVVPAIGRAMVTTSDAMAQLTGRADSAMTLTRPPAATTRELGKATVAGLATTTFEVVSGESVTRVWVAPSLRKVADALRALAGTMMGMLGGPAPDGLDHMDALYEKGFPVRTASLTRVPAKDATPGEWTLFWSETKVDSSPLPDSLFAVPAGITVVRMGGQ